MKRVLLAEDDKDLAEMLALAINKLGCRVDIAFSGEAAIRYLKTEVFDLVISDYQMPDGKGDKVLEYILNFLPNTRFIFFTSENGLQLPPVGGVFRGLIPKTSVPVLLELVSRELK